MSTIDIPLDKAELLAILLEGLLYGFSLSMFGGTVWALSSQRTTHQINRKMLTVSCLLLLFSTTHLVIGIIRVMEGFILFRDTFPGGPVGYFSDVSHWTFVSMNYVYTAQTLIADGVVLYRCYAVWQSKLVMILPVLLWCAVLVTGFVTPDTESHAMQHGVFGGCLSRWIVAFWTSTLITNLLTTLLLAYRVWRVSQKPTSSFDHRNFQLRSILHVVIDAGAIYSFTLLTALICFVNRSNGQYVILDMITPIISITFYMVIIRVGLANRVNQPTNTLPISYTSTGGILAADRRSRIQVHRDIENHADNGQRLSVAQVTPTTIQNYRQSDIQFEDIAEVA